MPGFESLSVGVVIWLICVIALAGAVQGALGLGFPIVATPLIAAVTDMRTAVIVVLLPCLACVATNIAKTGSLRPVLAEFWAMPSWWPIYCCASRIIWKTMKTCRPTGKWPCLTCGMKCWPVSASTPSMIMW